jgi:hypothetical protein
MTEFDSDLNPGYKFAQANPSPVLSSTADGTLRFVNPAASKLMHDLELEHVKDLLPDGHESLVKACLSTGTTLTEECHLGDRNIVWSYRPIDEGDVVYIYGHDVTKYQSEPSSSKGLADANPHPVLTYSLNGEVLFKNHAVSMLLDDLKLETIEDILPVNHEKLVKSCVKTRAPIAEDRVVSGRDIVWSYRLSDDYEAVHIYGYDVTDQHPEDLPVSSLPEVNPSPVITAGPGGTTRYANNATLLLLLDLGLDSVEALLPPDHKGMVKACHSTKTPLASRHQVGLKIFTWSYHPVVDSDVIYIYGHDITDYCSNTSAEED